TLSPLPRPVVPESSAEAPVRQSRGGLLSVALAVFEPSRSNPGRYPAHCPAEFGLSSPARSSYEPARQRSPDRLHSLYCKCGILGTLFHESPAQRLVYSS